MKQSGYRFASGVIVLAVSAAGCGSATSTQTSASTGGTFSVAELEPPSFIPGQNQGGAEDELNAIFAPLTKFNAQNRPAASGVSAADRSAADPQARSVVAICVCPKMRAHDTL